MDMQNIAGISIKLASPDKIKKWSNGEVKKPETINYRTLKPERDGLFCEKIFGCVKDWECSCGSLKTIRYKDVKCERCGVEVTHSKVRREKMGHIELVAPVTHIWYLKGTTSRLGTLLEISAKELERVIYFEKYIVVKSSNDEIPFKSLISIDEYNAHRDEWEDTITVGIGAEGVKEVLKNIDLNNLKNELLEKLGATKSKQKIKTITKRLTIVKAFLESGNKAEWMILDVLPVIPPDLRPMVQLDGGRFATSDLNDLYRRVINRNNRLKRLKELKAPKIIIRNEMRMLQESVDALFDNGRRGRKVMGSANRPLKSLTDMLRGKQGRFRQNLLGKRVDYSGRSVIVVGPELELHQCGLPKKMALELFTPFVMHRLVAKDIVNNIKSAKRYVEQARSEVWDALDEVIKDHPVMLNRAPTLHRLGIQAFQPVLVEGKAIKLHPLVCVAFNADFDGDQMAVHVPLSREAIIETQLLMLSKNNMLSPANGKPIIGPTQDIVLGLYYITKDKPGAKGSGKIFADKIEAFRAYDENIISIHSIIKVRMNNKIFKTTVGRIIFNDMLPDGYEYQNKTFNKSDLNKLLYDIFVNYGHDETVRVADGIKSLGYDYSTISGISLGVTDLIVPDMKNELIHKAYEEVDKINEQYMKGIISPGEKYDKQVNIWDHITKEVTKIMIDEMEVSHGGFNPVYIMATSGARGGKDQIRQLAGMRGLMADPSGKIKETPIVSNFREGLTVYEFFQSTSGSRKGLTDTALKTANAGYLTRRLVDVAQDVIVIEEDCKTLKGITLNVKDLKEKGEEVYEKILGRVALEDIIDVVTQMVIVKAGEIIDEDKAMQIDNAGVEDIKFRSILTCETPRGVCAKCYGRDLSSNKLVEIGEAVGIIAAQSIGEPGTQLTLRTFHVGGVASSEDNYIRAMFNGKITKMPRRDKQRDGSEPVVEEEYILGSRIGKIFISKDAVSFTTSKGRNYVQEVNKNMRVKILANNKETIDSEHPVVKLEFLSPLEGKITQFRGDTVLVHKKTGDNAFRVPMSFEKKVVLGKNIKKGDVIAERVFKSNFMCDIEINKLATGTEINLISKNEENISGVIQRKRLVESSLYIGAEIRVKEGSVVNVNEVIGENPSFKPVFSKIEGRIEFYNVQIQKEQKEYIVIRPEAHSATKETEQGTAIIWKGKDYIVRGELKVAEGQMVTKGDELGENITTENSGKITVLRTYKTRNSNKFLYIVRVIEFMEKYPLPYLRYTGTTAGASKKVSKIKKSIIKLISKTNIINPHIFRDFDKIHKELNSGIEELGIKPVEVKDSDKKIKTDFDSQVYIVPNSSLLDEIDTMEQKIINSAREKLRIKENELVAKQFSDFFKLGKKGEGSTRQRGITQDIVTGLPRIEELFEVRKPKTDPAIVTEIDGEIRIPDDFSLKRTVTVLNHEVEEDSKEYKIPMEKQLIVLDGDYIEAGDPLTDGPVDLHTMLRVQGEMAVQKYIVREIQEVYKTQGVFINDKHIETIVRQMMRKVKIKDPGDTRFLGGEETDIFVLRQENDRVKKEKGKQAKYETLLKGITNVSKHSESFISAASFQETPWALTEAAIRGKKDELFGLKENVIIGHLIPAGTGHKKYRNVEPDFEGKKEVEQMLLEQIEDESEETQSV